MKFETAQKRIEKLGSKNNTLTIDNRRLTITIDNRRLTITSKYGQLDDIIVEFLDQKNPFNTGEKPFIHHYYRTLNVALRVLTTGE